MAGSSNTLPRLRTSSKELESGKQITKDDTSRTEKKKDKLLWQHANQKPGPSAGCFDAATDATSAPLPAAGNLSRGSAFSFKRSFPWKFKLKDYRAKPFFGAPVSSKMEKDFHLNKHSRCKSNLDLASGETAGTSRVKEHNPDFSPPMSRSDSPGRKHTLKFPSGAEECKDQKVKLRKNHSCLELNTTTLLSFNDTTRGREFTRRSEFLASSDSRNVSKNKIGTSDTNELQHLRCKQSNPIYSRDMAVKLGVHGEISEPENKSIELEKINLQTETTGKSDKFSQRPDISSSIVSNRTNNSLMFLPSSKTDEEITESNNLIPKNRSEVSQAAHSKGNNREMQYPPNKGESRNNPSVYFQQLNTEKKQTTDGSCRNRHLRATVSRKIENDAEGVQQPLQFVLDEELAEKVAERYTNTFPKPDERGESVVCGFASGPLNGDVKPLRNDSEISHKSSKNLRASDTFPLGHPPRYVVPSDLTSLKSPTHPPNLSSAPAFPLTPCQSNNLHKADVQFSAPGSATNNTFQNWTGENEKWLRSGKQNSPIDCFSEDSKRQQRNAQDKVKAPDAVLGELPMRVRQQKTDANENAENATHKVSGELPVRVWQQETDYKENSENTTDKVSGEPPVRLTQQENNYKENSENTTEKVLGELPVRVTQQETDYKENSENTTDKVLGELSVRVRQQDTDYKENSVNTTDKVLGELPVRLTQQENNYKENSENTTEKVLGELLVRVRQQETDYKENSENTTYKVFGELPVSVRQHGTDNNENPAIFSREKENRDESFAAAVGQSQLSAECQRYVSSPEEVVAGIAHRTVIHCDSVVRDEGIRIIHTNSEITPHSSAKGSRHQSLIEHRIVTDHPIYGNLDNSLPGNQLHCIISDCNDWSQKSPWQITKQSNANPQGDIVEDKEKSIHDESQRSRDIPRASFRSKSEISTSSPICATLRENNETGVVCKNSSLFFPEGQKVQEEKQKRSQHRISEPLLQTIWQDDREEILISPRYKRQLQTPSFVDSKMLSNDLPEYENVSKLSTSSFDSKINDRRGIGKKDQHASLSRSHRSVSPTFSMKTSLKAVVIDDESVTREIIPIASYKNNGFANRSKTDFIEGDVSSNLGRVHHSCSSPPNQDVLPVQVDSTDACKRRDKQIGRVAAPLADAAPAVDDRSANELSREDFCRQGKDFGEDDRPAKEGAALEKSPLNITKNYRSKSLKDKRLEDLEAESNIDFRKFPPPVESSGQYDNNEKRTRRCSSMKRTITVEQFLKKANSLERMPDTLSRTRRPCHPSLSRLSSLPGGSSAPIALSSAEFRDTSLKREEQQPSFLGKFARKKNKHSKVSIKPSMNAESDEHFRLYLQKVGYLSAGERANKSNSQPEEEHIPVDTVDNTIQFNYGRKLGFSSSSVPFWNKKSLKISERTPLKKPAPGNDSKFGLERVDAGNSVFPFVADCQEDRDESSSVSSEGTNDTSASQYENYDARSFSAFDKFQLRQKSLSTDQLVITALTVPNVTADSLSRSTSNETLNTLDTPSSVPEVARQQTVLSTRRFGICHDNLFVVNVLSEEPVPGTHTDIPPTQSLARRCAVSYEPKTKLLPKSHHKCNQGSFSTSFASYILSRSSPRSKLPAKFYKTNPTVSDTYPSAESLYYSGVVKDYEKIRPESPVDELEISTDNNLSSNDVSKDHCLPGFHTSLEDVNHITPLAHSVSSADLNFDNSLCINRCTSESPARPMVVRQNSVQKSISFGQRDDISHFKTPQSLVANVQASSDPLSPSFQTTSKGPSELGVGNTETETAFSFPGSCNTVTQPFKSPYDLLGTTKEKPRLQKLIDAFQNHKEPRMDALVQRLDHYSKHGIPRQPHLLFSADQEGQDHEVTLEAGGWRDVVLGWRELTDRLCQQQSAIWELVETEATYIQMIRVITNLFLSCLCNLQNDSLLNEINTELLFSNIPEIYRSNMVFWQEHVSGMLAEARRTNQPLDPTLLYDSFTNFTELFQPYTQYCLQQTQCQQYCKDRYTDNEHFKLYLAWCETQKECNRLRLVDIVVQPMQRLTKYSLLLKAILKKTDLDEHRWKLQEMISHVERFVSNVNSALRHRHEQDRLRDTISRIELYDAVEAKEEEMAAKVKQYSELQLSQPMPGCPEHLSRHLLHQGDYRLRDNNTGKTDVHVFIFTDLLLITKVTQRKAEKVKVIRPPYNVERLVEVVSSGRDSTTLGLIVLTEWGVPSAAFSLTSPDLVAHKALQAAIKKAKKQYLDAQSGGRDLLEEITSGLRSPRLASSRASRGSSLAPSQSGSVDLTDPGQPHTTSPAMLEVSELRASSASSEDSVEGPRLGQHSVDSSSRSTTGQHLSVNASHASGQSLPNLSVASGGNSHLKVPSTHKNHAPWNRGVSYPPPSPRALRRSPPVPQSRNPPLLKTRHVVSTTCAMGSNQATAPGGATEAAVQQVPYEEEDPCRSPRRICRSDRLDNRRYHTTGAIDDIKKQDTKDSSIHKRLSWNYGQQQPAPQPPLQQQIQQASAPGGLCTSCSAQTFVTPSNSTCSSTSSRLTCSSTASSRLTGGHCDGRRHKLSCESMHSSSGVSSTSSLHRSVTSEVETIENIDDSELSECDRTIVDLGIGEFAGGGDTIAGAGGVDYGVGARFSPHISSTYICQDALGMVGVGGSCATQYITQQPLEGPESEEGALSPAMVTIDVSNSCGNIPSAVQITVTEGPNPSSENCPDPCDSRLADSSESSYVTDPALSFTPASPVHTMTTPTTLASRGTTGPLPPHTFSALTHPSVVPPEVPPRSSSPKIPVQRTPRQSANPVPCATSHSLSGDGQRALRSSRNETTSTGIDKNTQVETEQRLVSSAIGANETTAELGACVGETSNCSGSGTGGGGDGSSSSTNTTVATDDESDSPSSTVSRLANSFETRSSSTVASSIKREDSFPPTPIQATNKSISTPDSNSSTASLASCTSSTLSASSSSSTSSFSSSASSSKCASNSYASLSSPASSSSSSLSKQSLSRESGVRELLLSDAAVETSDV